MGRKRIYEVNEDFFKEWNRDMAYVLGFFTADGHLEKNSICFEIKDDDLNVLRYVKRVTKSSHPITVNGKYIRFRICSNKMAEDLRNLFYFKSDKTFDYKINFDIPLNFIGDFIRGFFDGDGWVYTRRNSISSGFCSGSKRLLEDIHVLIGGLGKKRVQIDKRPNRKPLYSIDLWANDSLLLRDMMYKDEPFCLSRKKEKFWNFYTPSEKLWTKDQEKVLKENIGLTIPEISKVLNKSEKSVQMKKLKMGLCPKRSENWKWTKEEDDKVKLIKDVDILVKELNRKRSSIYARLSKFGLIEGDLWSQKEELFLIENFNMPRKWLIKEMRKSEGSIKSKLIRLRRDDKIPKIKSGRPKR